MNLYKTTKFTNQTVHSVSLGQHLATINTRVSDLRQLASFQGQTTVSAHMARNAVKQASGNPRTANGYVYETPIGGYWRIFSPKPILVA